ncbi:MAG: hypothetical protein LBV41_12585 [Cytophagaceae bacterium]|jgi:hypothetical protein|nr:hypothetical protein [Cytophagaceae bacterium]
MLTLNNFEKQIDSTIVQRGRSYYNDGLVGELKETAENVWATEVYGSDDYSVEVSLANENEIRSFVCDCPYDGPVCKHVTAVCYAIREEKAKAPKTITAKPSSKQKNGTFDDLLNAVDLAEYKDFVSRHASRNRDFKAIFELFFSDKVPHPDVEKKYSMLIRKIIRKYSDHGFIDYRASRQLSSEIGNLLAQGNDMVAKGNFRDAFLMCKASLKELIEALKGCDDSSGEVGGVLSDAIELLAAVVRSNDAAPAIKQQIFEYLQTELAQEQYFEYGDFGYELFAVFYNLAVLLGHFAAFIDFIDQQCRKLTGRYGDYHKEFLQKKKIAFYREIGRGDAAEKLVRQNMDIVEIRQAEVEKSIRQKDYAEAKRLIADGICIAEKKQHSGTVAQWKKELLQIAVAENDTKAIRQLAQHFALDYGFNKDYYWQWKQTYPAVEQNEAIEKLITERLDETKREYAKQKNPYFAPSQPPYLRSVAPVYIEEQMWDRLLALVQADHRLDTLLNYHEHLAKHYPEEMLAMYMPQFEFFGKKVEGRSQYADLATKMKRVLMDIPEANEPITALVRKLITQNPRRPAMIEELNKVLKI